MRAASAGEVLFARYAYPPNELGYCGPADSAGLLGVAGGDGTGARERAQAFDGAWVYLEMIAAATGLDPLHERVVEAYWVGNELLDRVDPVAFAARARQRFSTELGADWAVLDGPDGPSSLPHHSFQVFTVYPWVKLLGRGPTPLRVLDRCRIRTATVLNVEDDDVVVRSSPLRWDDGRLGPGEPEDQRVRWASADRALVEVATDRGDPLRAGDLVALHWDWVCDRLTEAQADELEARTAAQLALTNWVRR